MSSGTVPVFLSSGQPGYSSLIDGDPRRVTARKRVRELEVRFTPVACVLQTDEGVVHAQAGDAIVTGSAGDQWCVARALFFAKYRPVPPTVAGEAGRYASLPNRIVCVRMNETFEVLLPDGISRLFGHTGDWLVDYGDGTLGVVADPIFAKTYEIVS